VWAPFQVPARAALRQLPTPLEAAVPQARLVAMQERSAVLQTRLVAMLERFAVMQARLVAKQERFGVLQARSRRLGELL